tara:strand:- start:125 stop:259 length:135 start_codon:yes stop_codon:yes gene_type:complete
MQSVKNDEEDEERTGEVIRSIDVIVITVEGEVHCIAIFVSLVYI